MCKGLTKVRNNVENIVFNCNQKKFLIFVMRCSSESVSPVVLFISVRTSLVARRQVAVCCNLMRRPGVPIPG